MTAKRSFLSTPDVAVIGPGSVGLTFAGLLSKAGANVLLIHKNEDSAKALAKNGFKIKKTDGTILRCKVPVIVQNDTQLVAPHLIIVAVKTYDTARAVQKNQRLFVPGTTALFVQNGLGPDKTTLKRLNKCNVFLGLQHSGARRSGRFSITLSGTPTIFIGSLDGKRLPAWTIRLLKKADYNARQYSNIDAILWNKLAVNCAINSVSAIAGIKNAEILNNPHLLNTAVAAAGEVLELARALQIKAKSPDKARQVVVQACTNTSENKTSMLQDVVARKRTEIASLNGEVVVRSKKLGLPAKVNRQLYNQIRALEKTYILPKTK